MSLDVVERKISIQGHGIKISPALKAQLHEEGYYPIALTWLGDDVTGPFSFSGYGERSPFELRHVDGGYHVFEDGKHFSEVTFYRRPGFFGRQWNPDGREDGDTIFIDEGMSGAITPCGQDAACQEDDEEIGDVQKVTNGRFPFVNLACYNGLVVWPSWGCLYNQQGKACRFCCIPGRYEEAKVLIQDPRWLDAMAEAVEAALAELGADERSCSLTIDAGTLPGRDKGARAYVEVLDAIRRRLGRLPETFYIRAVIEPPVDEVWLRELRKAGFTDVQMDVDVYDEDERRRLMPNAKGYRPLADYERAFAVAKEIFPGEVATQLVAGIQSDERLLDGVDRFAALGVPTLVTPFLPFGQGRKLVRLGEAQVPSAERMRALYGRAAEILTRRGVAAPQFRGGVSSLAETMGRRLKRARALTNPRDLRPPHHLAAVPAASAAPAALTEGPLAPGSSRGERPVLDARCRVASTERPWYG